MQFRVEYQERPFISTRRKGLLVESESLADAFATVYLHLTGLGHTVSAHDEAFYRQDMLPYGTDVPAVISQARALGVPKNLGNTEILLIEPFQVKAQGRVLGPA